MEPTLHLIAAWAAPAVTATAIGNLIALYLKDVFIARSFERWKARQQLVAVYERYRRPICIAAEELGGRCKNLSVSGLDEQRRVTNLESVARVASPPPTTDEAGADYIRYRFMSDAYRLCCFLGWLELYRRDLGLLDSGADRRNRALDACLENIRADIADGQLNTNNDRSSWTDVLIFREEQRALGSRMIAQSSDASPIDFGTFCERLEQDPLGTNQARWLVVATRFFSDLTEVKDFRLERMRRLLVHLTDLRQVMIPGSVSDLHIRTAEAVALGLIGRGHQLNRVK
jgi:hypothetical protein